MVNAIVAVWTDSPPVTDAASVTARGSVRSIVCGSPRNRLWESRSLRPGMETQSLRGQIEVFDLHNPSALAIRNPNVADLKVFNQDLTPPRGRPRASRVRVDAIAKATFFLMAASSYLEVSHAYRIGREPITRISTSRLALCCQSGLVAVLATPMRARSRSMASRSLRMSPLLIALFTSARIASQTCA